MTKIIFVCSGNVFRSMSAEYLLKKYSKEHNLNLLVCSAGIHSNGRMNDFVLNNIKKYNKDVSKHKPKKITKKLIEKNDLIVAMGKNHQKYLKEKYNIHAPLFNEIAFNKKTSIKDNCEVLDQEKTSTKEWNQFNKKTIEYINNSMENFVKNLNKFTKK